MALELLIDISYSCNSFVDIHLQDLRDTFLKRLTGMVEVQTGS